jgi:hypothetical protein
MKMNRRPLRRIRSLWVSLSVSLLLGLGAFAVAVMQCPTPCGPTGMILTPDELARARTVLPGI